MSEVQSYKLIEYTDEQLSKLTTEQLQKLLKLEKSRRNPAMTNQMSRKVLINSLYGSLGSPYFRYYSITNAEAVTAFGQMAIKWVSNLLNSYANKALNTDDVDYILYNDTDSVTGETVISVNGWDIKIEDYYNIISNDNIIKNEKDNFVKRVTSGDITPSVNKQTQLEDKKITYIMKHKVSKKLYLIYTPDNDVTVTEDHSIMVMRDGALISCKPFDIKCNDVIIIKNKESIKFIDNFFVYSLGLCYDTWVYDIEVEDNHNFFGNNILVHNSLYMNLEPLVELIIKKHDKPVDDHVELVNVICNKLTSAVVKPGCEALCKFMNNIDNKMNMDREAISIQGGFFVAKKRYALSVDDNEGVRYAEPHLKITGIETQRSSTPKVVTNYLLQSIKAIILEGEDKLQDIVEELRTTIKDFPIDQLCGATSANNISTHGDELLNPKLGCPGHIRGALAYNRYLHNKDIKSIPHIADGEKINIINLILPNAFGCKVFGWPAGSEIDPEIFGDITRFIDYNTIFEEKYLKVINSLCGDIKKMSPVAVSTLESFFG